MNDCRTCKFNSYRDLGQQWFTCLHPVTLERGPHRQQGDPAMVDWRTGDVPMREIDNFADCPTFAEAEGTKK